MHLDAFDLFRTRDNYGNGQADLAVCISLHRWIVWPDSGAKLLRHLIFPGHSLVYWKQRLG